MATGLCLWSLLLSAVAALGVGTLGIWLYQRRSYRKHSDRLRFLSVLIDTIPNPVYCKDTRGCYVDCNNAFASQMFGLPKEAVLGQTLRQLAARVHIPPEWLDLYQSQDEELLKKPGVQNFEAHAKYADGSVRQVLFSKATFCDRRGALSGFVGVIVDLSEHKQALQALQQSEEQLRRSQAHLQAIFDNAGMAVAISDASGRWSEVNQRAAQIFGCSFEEFINAGEEAQPPSGRKHPYQAVFDRLLSGEAAQHSLEKRYLCADGSVMWGHIMFTPVRDRDKRASEVIGLIWDITEQKLAQEALRESEERFRAIFENMSNGIGVIGCHGKYLQVNDQFAQMMGYSRQELLTLSPLDLTPSQDLLATKKQLEELLNGRQDSYHLEKRFQRKDGSIFWADVSATVMRGSQGGVQAYIGIIRDITERRRAQKELQLAKFSIERGADAAFWIGPDGRFLFINEAAWRRLGYAREELLSLTVHDIDPNFPKEVWGDHWQDLKARGSATFESLHRRKDGSVFPVEITANYLEFEGKEYNFAYAHDISKRKQSEEEKLRLESQLRESQKMEAVGQLAGGIAHDFNNVLSIILGNIALLKHILPKEFSATTPILGELSQIEHAAQRAATLTRQLLTFSRRQVAKPVILNLNQVVGDTEKMLRRIITENISLQLKLAGTLANVHADPGQLEQVIINLSLNARDAMPSGGILTLETANSILDHLYAARHAEIQPGNYVMLAISDTGCGMSEETQSHLFEPFFTTKPVGQGTGLGLATVYGIVRQSSGYIVAYSELNKGTTFKIFLPVASGSASTPASRVQDEESLHGHGIILLCEDDDGVRRLAAQILTQAGYTVLSAADGRQALKIAAQHKAVIDLLVTDVIMPDMNGRQLSAQLSASRPGLKTLYVSGYAADIIAHHGVLDPGVHFLEKPFSWHSLLKCVHLALTAVREDK